MHAVDTNKYNNGVESLEMSIIIYIIIILYR